MRKETKGILMNIRRSLTTIRKKVSVKHPSHYLDLRWDTWNNPLDGLDYAIHLIDKQLKRKSNKEE